MSNRSRRLRKKLKIGEFAVSGMSVDCSFSPLSERELNTLEEQLCAFLISKELCHELVFHRQFVRGSVYKVLQDGPMTKDERESVKQWLESRAIVNSGSN